MAGNWIDGVGFEKDIVNIYIQHADSNIQVSFSLWVSLYSLVLKIHEQSSKRRTSVYLFLPNDFMVRTPEHRQRKNDKRLRRLKISNGGKTEASAGIWRQSHLR